MSPDRRLLLLLTLLAVVLLPALAHGATIVETNPGGIRTYSYNDEAGDADSLSLYMTAGKYVFDPSGGETFTALPATCTPMDGATQAHCTPVNVNDQLTVNLLDGDDFVFATATGVQAITVQINFRGAAGNDQMYGGGGNDDMDGGAGADYITGQSGGDNLRGGDGADDLQGGIGRDDIQGGGGVDEALYYEKQAAQPIVVTLDDQANDGVVDPAELENIHSDVEDVTGGQGNDRIVGSDGDNILHGGPGNDTLIGLLGIDVFFGEDGDDSLQTRDGIGERVDCGNGNDNATTDVSDSASACEANAASAELQPDSDGDGVIKGADCNDANPAIRPGAKEVLDNGIDEDCDGADGVNNDRDADGVTRPLDCNDTLATIRPGLSEVVGNPVDENCDGTASPFPRLDPGIANAWAFTRRSTRVTTLAVLDVPAGATVQTRCTGRGCPRGTARTRVRRETDELNLQRRFRGRRLRPGAVVEIRVTKAQSIGKVVRYTIRAGAIPRRTLMCLLPGATKPATRC